MFKVKTVKRQTKPQLTFKEWVQTSYADGRYLIRRIFPPRRYPSAAIVFETDNAYVKMNVDPETWKAFAKQQGVVKGKDIAGEWYLVVKGDDIYIDPVKSGDKMYAYDASKGIWQLRYVNSDDGGYDAEEIDDVDLG